MMEARRELDALIAEKVMGLGPFGWSGPPRSNDDFWSHDKSILYPTCEEATQRYQEYVVAKHGALRGKIDEHDASFCHWKEGWGPLAVEEYSTDIAAAWLVVEKLADSGFHFLLLKSAESKLFTTTFYRGADDNRETLSSDSCAPHAICLAALKAIGVPCPTNTSPT